jgi:polysaccharide biosynthesis protein PelD
LAAHGIDHLRFGTAVSSVARFIAAFNRIHQDHWTFGLDATLIRLRGSRIDVTAANEKLRSSVRAIDIHCEAVEQGNPVLWVLLPLTDAIGARAWTQRAGRSPSGLTSEVLTIREIDPQRIRALVPLDSD